MAYIPIPTGQSTVTSTVRARRLLFYQCFNCQEAVIAPYEISAMASDSYHAFQSESKKQAARASAAAGANSGLILKDRMMFTNINERRDYRMIARRCECPRCGKTQPWSDNSAAAPALCALLLLAASAIALLAAHAYSEHVFAWWLGALLCAGMGLWGLRQIAAKRRAVRELVSRGESLPIYINADNIAMLGEPPFSTLVARYTCPGCGELLDGKSAQCPKCHAPCDPRLLSAEAARLKRRYRGFGAACLGLAVVAACLGFGFQGTGRVDAPPDIGEVAVSQLETPRDYRASVMILDAYASSGDGDWYLTGVMPVKDDLLLCNIQLHTRDAIYGDVQKYLKDDSAKAGDLVAAGVYTLKRFSPASELAGYRDRAFDDIEEMAGAADITVDRHLVMQFYCADDTDEYARLKARSGSAAGYVCYGFAGLAALIGVLLLLAAAMSKRKKVA